MPRIGANPLREQKAPKFIRDIVCLVVTHLPEFTGYHENRFDVVKACLLSMRNNIHKTHSFYVFDNGSSDVFRDWLYNEFKPDFVTFAPNIGKTAARTTAISSLPPETLVCYSDDDILYFDNWLSPQLDILTTFPNVGVVSGYPVRTQFRWGNKNTLLWASKNATVEVGRFIPDEYEIDFCNSVERSFEEHKEKTINDNDIKITYQNKSAYATAHHCQFIGYAGRLLPALSYDMMAMGDEKKFDIAIDGIGLRLCTIERQCRHIGNYIDEALQVEINSMMVKHE